MKPIAATVLLLALLGVAACGDDTSPRSADPGPRTLPQPLTPTEPLSAWTKPLREALAGCERIRVRRGGYYGEGDVPRGRVLFEVEGVADVRRVTEGISIDDARSDSICMCSGQLTLEFHAEDALAAVSSFHHGRSLRWHGSPAVRDGDPWVHDGALTAGSGRFLKDWLVRSGVAPHLVGRDPPPWAKVAPEQIAEAKKHDVPVAFENDLGMRFVLIPAGTFLMGSPEDEEGRDDDETQHEVTITKPCYMQITEATVREYEAMQIATDVRWWSFPPGHPRLPTQGMYPMPENFASWLSTFDSRRTYRLPTEAEWEYACRSGTTTAYSTGEKISIQQANFGGGVRDEQRHAVPTDVGSYPPNGWGLHDMHGNVREWCLDPYGPYPGHSRVDFAPPAQHPLLGRSGFFVRGSRRANVEYPLDDGRAVVRGGSCGEARTETRCARRRSEADFMFSSPMPCPPGFRLVSPLPEPSK